jgi:hypothetical protein
MTTNNDLIATAATPTSTTDPVAELVGEGKKYKDVAALAASRIEADRFIEQLKTEAAGLRQELAAATAGGASPATIQSLIERIEAATKPQNSGQPGGTLSKEEVEKLVKDGITAEQAAAARRANYATANAALLNFFKGDADKASAHLRQRSEALGLSGEALTELASTNPKMFRELMVPQFPAFDGRGNALPPAKSGVAVDMQTEKRNAQYYSKLRKELGNKFWAPEIQQQMFRDRKALGAEFNAN